MYDSYQILHRVHFICRQQNRVFFRSHRDFDELHASCNFLGRRFFGMEIVTPPKANTDRSFTVASNDDELCLAKNFIYVLSN